MTETRSAVGAAEPHLFLVIDCAHPAAPGARIRLSDLDEVHVGRGETRGARRSDDGGVRALFVEIADDFSSTRHARFVRVLDRWTVEDAGSKNGSLVNGVPVDKRVLADGDIIELGHTLFMYRAAIATRGTGDVHEVEQLLDGAPGLRTLVPDLARLFDEIAGVATSDLSVVLHGETGTGKELLARTIHELSRRTGSYVGVDCGSLPANLVAAELLGYRKGAFPGADAERLGLVRHADHGTLFLDEIGELDAAGQATLVRLLADREVVPHGSDQAIRVDFRLVVATHRDLPALVETGAFRADLYARISGFTVELPPLRDRREDLGILVGALLRSPATPALHPKAGRCLLRYAWPGNIRELEKSLERATVLARGKTINFDNLPESLRATPEASIAEAPDKPTLEALLREHHGNISAIARRLGKAPVQIRRWLKRHGLVADEFRDG